jgi:prepilin-type N-terminal cleavage/methylation domain-containing protein
LAISPLGPVSSSNSLKVTRLKKVERFAFFNRFNSFNLLATKVRFLNRIRVSQLRTQSGQQEAFTLIELLVVIAIIAILIGLLFPAFRAVQDQAKRTQAKNDLTQIVNAVNAYYTEYGRYPLPAGTTTDKTFGPGGDPSTNETLFNPLRGVEPVSPTMLNPRQIVFILPPAVKDPANPRSGIATAAGNLGQYFDPWGSNYVIRIDGNYDNQLPNPYTADTGAGPATLTFGVIAWSLGKNQAGGSGDKNSVAADDDVISWQ